MKIKILLATLFLLFIPVFISASSNGVIRSNITDFKSTGDIYTITGNAYLNNVPFDSADDFTTTLDLYKENNMLQVSVPVTNVHDTTATSSYKSSVDISYSKFTTSININDIDLPIQNYKVFVTLTDKSGRKYSEQLYSNTSNITNNKQLDNILYTVGTKNNRCFITVSEVPTNPKTWYVDGKISSSGVYLEGVGYINGIPASKSGEITQSVQLIDSNGTVVKEEVLGNYKNAFYMALFSHNLFDYSFGYFKGATKKVFELPVGTYSVGIKLTTKTGFTQSEQFYSNDINKIYSTYTKNGKNYSLYSQNNRMFIDIK